MLYHYDDDDDANNTLMLLCDVLETLLSAEQIDSTLRQHVTSTIVPAPVPVIPGPPAVMSPGVLQELPSFLPRGRKVVAAPGQHGHRGQD